MYKKIQTKASRYSSILTAEKQKHIALARLARDKSIKAAHRDTAAALDFALAVIAWTCGEQEGGEGRQAISAPGLDAGAHKV